LQTGMQREFKRFLVPIIVLIITAGFPAMASFVTREDLTLGPWPIASNDEPGVVLGDNTGTSTGSTSSPQGDQTVTSEPGEPNTQSGVFTPQVTSTQPKKSPTTSSSTTPLPSAPTTPEGGQGGSDPLIQPILDIPGLDIPCECGCICPLIL